ncbi:sodium/hydrogen exchanger 9B2-like isoform X2 [Battus philenor]|uniref:sodium/hydrogen exchanger 9B2-like isoform X2 n=1 Tax=Battus philenor TaxID=42288 RepID=UPI0035CFBEB4
MFYFCFFIKRGLRKMNEYQWTGKNHNKSLYNDHKEMKTSPECSPNTTAEKVFLQNDHVKKKSIVTTIKLDFVHYFTLGVIGILTWGTLWCAFDDNWGWGGPYFRLAAVAAVAWVSGLLFQELTTLPPLLAALLTGIFARHFGFLDMRQYSNIDGFLRKIYPVIILGKGSLAWDTNYMKKNWKQVVTLGTIPWVTEVTTTAVCTHFFLGFPWLWGILLGSIYASVSIPVIMPLVQRHGTKPDRTQNWPQLICTAGGTDTALSVGVYGLIFTFMFSNANDLYRYLKAGLALFAGATLGVIWGSLAKLIPHSCDYYVTELRILFVLVGGLFANFFTSTLGWGGTGGVAVLACNATAASHWARKGWKLNQNPASTVYRVLWSACEPLLFAYTGTFFVAVLSPLAINALLTNSTDKENEMRYAEDLMRLIIQAILITTPIGFLLTNHLGPLLLKTTQNNKDLESQKRPSRDESIKEDGRL